MGLQSDGKLQTGPVFKFTINIPCSVLDISLDLLKLNIILFGSGLILCSRGGLGLLLLLGLFFHTVLHFLETFFDLPAGEVYRYHKPENKQVCEVNQERIEDISHGTKIKQTGFVPPGINGFLPILDCISYFP